LKQLISGKVLLNWALDHSENAECVLLVTQLQFSMYLVVETAVIFDCVVHIHLPEVYQQFYMMAWITRQLERMQILNIILKKSRRIVGNILYTEPVKYVQ